MFFKFLRKLHKGFKIIQINFQTLCLITSFQGSHVSSQPIYNEIHVQKIRVPVLGHPPLYLTIPTSNATCERGFSSLRRIKSCIRSTMTVKRLNHLLFLNIHKDLTDTINLNSVARSFIHDVTVDYTGQQRICCLRFLD